MAGTGTLIVTTRSGVRPLGVRGEPLHNTATQLRRVIRRRLGDGAAALLADPQTHDDGKAIDWYADAAGTVRSLSEHSPAERTTILATVDAGLAEIRRLGETLGSAGGGDDTGVVGRSLQLAAKRPSDSFVYMVGDRPVVVCWGYEKEAASSLLLATVPKPFVAEPAVAPRHVSVLPPASLAPAATIPWARALLAALPLLLLLLGVAWLLRDLLPAEPALALATREGPPALTAPTPPPDPRPLLRASLATEQAHARALQIEIAAIETELKKRVADCKPPELPKPPPPLKEPQKEPQVAVAPPPKPAPTPTPAPAPPAPQPRRPNDDRLHLPSGPTNDFSFLQGCWRTDPFRHETAQMQPGVSSYCFDANGRGQLEWRRGRTACRTRAQAQFDGPVLRLRDADTTCNDGSQWYADQLVCRRGADGVAQCSGSSRGAFGPVNWTVNLHKLN